MFKKLRKKIADINNPSTEQASAEAKNLKIRLVVCGSLLLAVGIAGAVFSLVLVLKYGMAWLKVLEDTEKLKSLLHGLFLLIPFVFVVIIGGMILNLGIKIKLKPDKKDPT